MCLINKKLVVILPVLFLLFTSTNVAEAFSVTVVGDSSATETNTKNTATDLKKLYDLTSTDIKNDLRAIKVAEETRETREGKLDATEFEKARILQGQLVAEYTKIISTGDDGEPMFITDYEEYYDKIATEAYAESIIESAPSESSNSCGADIQLQTKASLIQKYDERGEQVVFQCLSDEERKETNELDNVYAQFTDCSKDPICNYLQVEQIALTSAADQLAIEKQKVDISRGFKIQEICQDITNADGVTENKCVITTPPGLMASAADYVYGQLPFESLSDVNRAGQGSSIKPGVTSLTNHIASSDSGVLGLGGNSNYSEDVFFDDDGGLSYLDALLKDLLQKGGGGGDTDTPFTGIEDAMAAELEYQDMLEEIIDDLDDANNEYAVASSSYPTCFALATSSVVIAAEGEAKENLGISTSTLAVLEILNQEYLGTSDEATKDAIEIAFYQYESQGFFRDAGDNNNFQTDYLDDEFADLIDEFLYDIAIERYNCGGDFIYTGPRTTPTERNPST